jgi:UDP-N-acetylmuramate dehydrogenase
MIYDKKTIDSLLQEPFQGRVKREEPLAAHCSAKAGGPADFFLELTSTKEVERLVGLCCQFRVPLLLIGNGSNILFTDQGVRGIVACMRTKGYRLEGRTPLSALAIVDAAMTWQEASEQLAQEGWSGLEFGVGIPGTLGGAVVTNAAAHNEEIGQHVHWVEVLDARGCNLQEEGEFSLPQRRRYTQGELQLSNRKSRFREQRRAQISASGQLVPAPRPLIAPPEIILQLSVTVYRDDKQRIKQREANARALHQLQIFCSRPVTARASRIALIVASVPEEVIRSISTDGKANATCAARVTSFSIGAPNVVPRLAASATASTTAGWA